MAKKILIINGPNLNLLGTRNPEIYGKETLANIEKDCRQLAKELAISLEFKQSNSETEIITLIQEAINKFDGIIINAAAYTHTSIAIHDALEMFNGKKVELHISNIFKREEFRHKSMISSTVNAVISGFGSSGYTLSLLGINNLIDD